MTKKYVGRGHLSHHSGQVSGRWSAPRPGALPAMLLAGVVVSLAQVAPVSADVLLIEEVRQVERMDLPKNGLSKSAVESRFGAPEVRHDPVGDPPITRWQYGDYSVYFEYDLVLFSVLHSGAVIEEKA